MSEGHLTALHVSVGAWGSVVVTSREVPESIPGGVTGDFFYGSRRNHVDSASENEYQGFLPG
jgi:hypothetical protein